MQRNQTGFWSALAVFLIGVAYAVALAAGFAVHGLSEPIADPILAIMEGLTLASALPIVVLIAAIHDYARAERKVFGMIALAFAVIFAGATSSVHFVELTSARQLGSAGIVWPSTAYAIELLAWNLFLGLSLLFAAAVFTGEAPERGVRRAMSITGVLCVLGVVGPLSGNMRLQWVGLFGYAVLLPTVCLMLAKLFRGKVAALQGLRQETP